MEFIIDNSSSGTNSNIITGLSDNIVYNSTLLSSSNNLQSNIGNTSNYASNISNILRTLINTNLSDSSNYASNISNILLNNLNSNFLNLSGGTLKGSLNFNTLIDYNTIYNTGILGLSSLSNIVFNTGDSYNNLTTKLIINNTNGNIGIGTTTNLYKLNIDGSFNATSISSNGILINFNNYVTSNQLYGKIEKQYPPRKYDSSVITNTATIFGKTNVITETIRLNNGEYGAGDYIIYSSGIYQDRYKQNLFNFVINDSYSGGWGFNYIANEGNFNSSLTTYNINQPVNNYFGEWLIIKLPTSIVLSRFIFYPFLNTISRNPSLWRCYGSTDGTTFEIIDIACNNIALTASDYSKGYYEKKIPETFINSYIYYGFVFSKLVGGDSNATSLMFVELQLFGRDDTPSALFLTSLFNKNLLYYSTTGNDPTYISSNLLFNTILPLYSSNTSNYASNISNVIIQNNSNFTLGTSNILRDLINTNTSNTSNYSTNVSNVIIQNNSNFTLGSINNLINNDISLSGNINFSAMQKKITFSTTIALSGIPTSNLGGNGDRLILCPGNNGIYPYSIGIGGTTTISSNMWFSGPANMQYNWYANGSNIMNLTASGQLTTIDDIICFGNLSDKRLKTNINDLSINCINLLNKLKSVEFNWICHYRIPLKKRHTLDHGFIAQDIEEILPNLVNSDGEYKSLKYDKFTPYIIKAIQELYIIIQDQQNQINMIKSQLSQ